MGRKPKAAKAEEKPQLKFGMGIVHERKEELPPEGAKSTSNGLQMQPANTNPLLEKAKPMPLSADLSEKASKPKRKASASLSTNEKLRKEYGSVRRSGRLQNAVVPARSKDIGPVLEDITDTDSEKEDEPPLPEEDPLQKLSLSEMSLEAKVNYLLKKVELLSIFMEASNSKV